MEYDMIKGEFVSDRLNRDAREKTFIKDHINLFHLNDRYYRTNEIYRFCRDIIYHKQVNLEKQRYNNMIVDLFIDKLDSLPEESIYKICEIIYLSGVIMGRKMD